MRHRGAAIAGNISNKIIFIDWCRNRWGHQIDVIATSFFFFSFFFVLIVSCGRDTPPCSIHPWFLNPAEESRGRIPQLGIITARHEINYSSNSNQHNCYFAGQATSLIGAHSSLPPTHFLPRNRKNPGMSGFRIAFKYKWLRSRIN